MFSCATHERRRDFSEIAMRLTIQRCLRFKYMSRCCTLCRLSLVISPKLGYPCTAHTYAGGSTDEVDSLYIRSWYGGGGDGGGGDGGAGGAEGGEGRDGGDGGDGAGIVQTGLAFAFGEPSACARIPRSARDHAAINTR